MPTKEPPNRCVLRVRTTYYKTARGIATTKELNFLKTKCKGYNIFKEDCDQIGVDCAVDRIINLHAVDDGIYDIILVNERRDWETGCVEEWDYKLIPYEK